MATLKHRIRRKNSAGSYDVVHFETESGLVVRPNNETVETTLTKTLRMKNAEDTVPGFHAKIDADTLQGKTAAELVAGYAKSTELELVKTSVSEGKKLIAAAVTDKGVETAADATFKTMADNIGSIEVESAYAKALRTEVGVSVAVLSSFTGEIINASDFDLYIKEVKYSASGPYNVVSQTYSNGNVSDTAVLDIAMTKKGSAGTLMYISFSVDNTGLLTASIYSSRAPISYNIIDMTMNGNYLYITVDATTSSDVYEVNDSNYQCGWGPTLETGTRRIRLELYNWFWYLYTNTASHEFGNIALIRTK